MRTQFITDNSGNKLAVILSIKQYHKMLDDLEALEDVKCYDKAKQGPQEFVDAQQAFKEIEASRNNQDV